MDWADYLRFVTALVFVVALMGGLYLILKRFGVNGPQIPQSKKRLRVLEVLPLDSRRRAMLLQCDGKEHLVILGPTGETVVETRINASQSIKPDDDSNPLI